MEGNNSELIEATVCIDDLPKHFEEEEDNNADDEIVPNLMNAGVDEETMIVIDVNEINASYEFDEEEEDEEEGGVEDESQINGKLVYLGEFEDKEFQLNPNDVTMSTDVNGMIVFEYTESKETKSEPRKCEICNVEFQNHGLYMFHVRQSHPIVNQGQNFFCPFCDFQSKARNTIDQHLRVHTNEKPFQCRVCKKSFNQKAGVQQHMRTHSDAKPFACHLCESRFKAASTLSAHIMMKHEQLRPYVCEVCNASFGHSSNLLVHMRVHTGERPYKCDICSKTFVQHGHLKAHSRLHSGVKPFNCAYCNTAFTHIGNLRQHEITQHTKDYKHRCYKCSKGFIGPGDLRRHQQKMH